MQYTIPINHLPYLNGKIEELNKRAKKLGIAPSIITVLREYEKEVQKNGVQFRAIMCDIEVQSTLPTLNGYTFLATIEPIQSENGSVNNVIKMVPGIDKDVSEYRNTSMTCDHCGKIRARNSVYLVLHEDSNTIKQVGKSCLRDFIGNVDAEMYASWAESLYLLDKEIKEDTDDDMGHGNHNIISLTEYLEWCIATIHKYGFYSRAMQERDGESKVTTSQLALSFMQDFRIGKAIEIAVSEKDKKEAQDALQWIRDYDKNSLKGEYMYNLYAVCNGVGLHVKNIGLVASLYSAWQRATSDALLEKKEKKISSYVGKVGDKIKDIPVECVFVKEIDSYYGISTLHKFVDDKGNCYTWFSSSKTLEQGAKYLLSGTIKGHEEYNGSKQTVLTRCKYTEQ